MRLRRHKHRPTKPFAVMARDEAAADRECVIGPVQRAVLTGHQKPIALLPKKASGRAADADALAEETDRLLLARFSGRALPGAVRGAMQRLRESSGMLPVGELAAESGYSQRHLNRLFGETVGMNVKTFARLVRVNGAIRLLRQGSGSLAALAQEAGFYDQSHFIHDFSHICGVAPGAYLQNLSAFYNEIFKF